MERYTRLLAFVVFACWAHPAAATKFDDSKITQGLVNKTVTGVHIAEKTNSGDSYSASYTDMTGAAQTATGTAAAGTGLLDLHFQPKPGTAITVTNTTETITNPAIFASANDIFTPGTNVVVSAFAIGSGSQMTLAGNTFALAGSFTTVETQVDYNPASPTYGVETGHLASVNLLANGAGGPLAFSVSLGPTKLDLSSVWAQVIPTGTIPSTGISVPDNFPLSGTLSFGSVTSPFSGTFKGAVTFFGDGSTDASGTLMLNTDFGPAVGTLSASAVPHLAVPEPTTWSLTLLGVCGIGGLLRRKSRRAPLSRAIPRAIQGQVLVSPTPQRDA